MAECEHCKGARLFLISAGILALAIILFGYYTNLGSIEDRQAVVKDCNERIDLCNKLLGKCGNCIYERVNLTEILNVSEG